MDDPSFRRKRLEYWRDIIEVYRRAKFLVLFAEKITPGHKRDFCWAPQIQFRDALDHIVRAKKREKELESETEDKRIDNGCLYILKQLDRAKGHVYRAFYDLADDLSIILRERIRRIIGYYPREFWLRHIPGFTQNVEQKVDGYCNKIAILRNEKDVGDVSKTIDPYIRVILELAKIHNKLLADCVDFTDYGPIEMLQLALAGGTKLPDEEAAVDANQEEWRKLISIYLKTKFLVLINEETGPRNEFYWPPLFFQCETLDHVLRAQKSQLCNDSDKEAQSLRHLNTAIKCAKRAWVYVADRRSVVLRERMIAVKEQYPPESWGKIYEENGLNFADCVKDAEVSCTELAKFEDLYSVLDIAVDVDEESLADAISSYRKVIPKFKKFLKTLREYRDALDNKQSLSVHHQPLIPKGI